MRLYIIFLVLFINIFWITEVRSARILGVFPNPAISHQSVFRVYTKALVERGHELVIITPNPSLPKGSSSKNITEIDVSFSYARHGEAVESLKHLFIRGAIFNANDVWKIIYEALINMIVEIFDHPEVKMILGGKSQFDLIISESFIDYPLILTHILNVPVIQMSSFYGTPENFAAIGAISRHPILHPTYYRNKFKNLSYFEKLQEVYQELLYVYRFEIIEEIQNKKLKRQFGPKAPTIRELKEKVEMLLLNINPIFDGNRPVPPSVIYLGGIHLQPAKNLPQDLKVYLDNSIKGVVYVSFGTNINPALMTEEYLNVFLETFEALPYDFLWKYDGEIKRMPKNLKIQKWFPQRDLLTHPNVKAFITQGGIQSTDEAIDAGVPLVGIPMMGDQWYNTNKYEELGIGIQLNSYTVTSNELMNAINTVIDDNKFRCNITRLRDLMRDQPQPPLERAVWWTEYVLRHGGAKHLRAQAANMTWAEYFMIDVITTIVIALIFLTILSSVIIYFLVKLISTLLTFDIKIKKS